MWYDNNSIKCVVHDENSTVVDIRTVCPKCKRSWGFSMPYGEFIEGMTRRRKGAAIQDAFPKVDPNNRELFVSQICQECWDETFDHKEV